ncbi:MAG: septum formation protein Maf [Chloroflexi bacterium]|nr:MAG: septum formation protein Maf [Chloroflexota bacterium]RLT32505.1 MAG: septum formation protein Maf [Chloroflexota bacterium]
MKDVSARLYDVILASQSPRRAAILDALGVHYAVSVSDAEEEATFPTDDQSIGMPFVGVPRNDQPALRAWRKGSHIADLHPEKVVIAADTIVVCDGMVLNKPTDVTDAIRMLRLLSGRTHLVYTGLALFVPAQQPRYMVEQSDVEMLSLSDAEIHAYVGTGEPMDKAGAYGIQGVAGTLVQAVNGSFTNVVGMPMHATISLLTAAGIAVAQTLDSAYARWRTAHPLLRTELGREP